MSPADFTLSFPAAIEAEFACSDLTGWQANDDTPSRHVEALLAVPEMQVIRQTIRDFYQLAHGFDERMMLSDGLPANVIEWGAS